MGLSHFWSYVYYLTLARSEYYVHSPFVYTLMTNCLKKKQRFIPENRDKLLDRLDEYLKTNQVGIRIARIGTDVPVDSAFAPWHGKENAMVFIDHPHSNPQREKQWDALCQDPRISLTIDLFRVGLVFPTRDMRKEHFCLQYF